MNTTSFLQLYVHLVWATWDRLPLITPEVEEILHPALRAKATELGCVTYVIGGIEEHLHDLLAIPATVPLATIVRELKGASAHLINQHTSVFKWQAGYGAFTVAKPDLPRVIRYIQNQREHHRSGRLSSLLEQIHPETPVLGPTAAASQLPSSPRRRPSFK